MVKNKIVGGGHVSEMPWHLRSATKIILSMRYIILGHSLAYEKLHCLVLWIL